MFEGVKRNLEIRKLKKKILNDFMEEHGQYLPKYSPKGLKLKWNICVAEDGTYDIMTGEFIGTYKVCVSQKPPAFLGIDDTMYRYNREKKSLEATLIMWGYQ